MVIVIPAVAFLIGLGLGWLLLRLDLGRVALVLAVLLAVGIGWVLYMQEMAQGWDALAYAIVWALMLLPGLVGLGIGALVGRWRRLVSAPESEAA